MGNVHKKRKHKQRFDNLREVAPVQPDSLAVQAETIPQPQSSQGWMMRYLKFILPGGIAFVSIVIYLYTAAPFMLLEDAPRLLGAIVSLGIARPAEPVYVFLAHFFTYLPFSSVVFRVQLFSALLAGASLLLLYRLVIHILQIPKSLDLADTQHKKTRMLSHHLPKGGTILIAGIFGMLVLAFSYEFWTQAQNVETFILDCFIELIILSLLLSDISRETVFKRLAVVAVICGLALGTDPPVAACVFPSVLLVFWKWRAALGNRRIFIVCLVGFAAIVLGWLYLPFAESRHPLLNDANGATLQGIWYVATGQGLNANTSMGGIANGLTWSPGVMFASAWHYVVMAWMGFTPFILPFTLLGGVYLWQNRRQVFNILFLVAATNFVFSVLYLSGNREAWFLQSDIIFAVFAGVGIAWAMRIIGSRIPRLNLRVAQAGLLIIALIPLVYWWHTLDRHRWHFTQDYINNLYSPIQEPAIMIGTGDLWDAASSYAYATNYKHNIIPVWVGFAASDWLRTNLASTTHIRVPDASHYDHKSLAGYDKFINDFISDNIGKYHIYFNQPALEDTGVSGRGIHSFQVDLNRFRTYPAGMLVEVTLKKEEHSVDPGSFVYRFRNSFPLTKPSFLETNYTSETQDVINEIANSYYNAARYLANQGQNDTAGSFYQKAYALNPYNLDLLKDIGSYYIKQSQPEKALIYFRKASAMQPGNATWLYYMALANGQTGKADEEKALLKKVLSLSHNDASLTKKASAALLALDQPVIKLKNDMMSFTDRGMNLTFAYPIQFQVRTLTPDQVGLFTPLQSDSQPTMLFYSETVDKNTDLDTFAKTFPYAIKGTLVSTKSLSVPGFQEASKKYYQSPQNATDLFLLKQGNQVIAVTIPLTQSVDNPDFAKLLTGIIFSIKLLR